MGPPRGPGNRKHRHHKHKGVLKARQLQQRGNNKNHKKINKNKYITTIRNEKTPSLKNTERAATQTTLSGWVIASSNDGSSPLAGCMDDTEAPEIHNTYDRIERARITEGPRSRSSTTNVASKCINDTVNA